MANTDIDYTKYGAKPEDQIPPVNPVGGNAIDYSKYGAVSAPQTVDLGIPFFHDFPKNLPQYKLGTPENNELIKSAINQSIASPGMAVVGAAPEIMSSLAGKGFQNLKNIAQAAFGKLEPAEEAVQKATQGFETASKEAEPVKPGLYQNPTTQLENIEGQIGKEINAEANHGQRFSSGLSDRGKAIENFWSDSFKNFHTKIADAKFEMPPKAMENFNYGEDYDNAVIDKVKKGADPKTAYKLVENERNQLKGNPYYQSLIDVSPTPADTNAGDFLAKFRDYRDTLGGLKQDMKSENILSGTKKIIQKAIDAGQEKFDQIKEVLNQGLGEYKPEFDWINEGYSTQVYPLRNNVLMRAAKEGKAPSDLISSLQTNQKGMSLVRDLVKQDPELLRNVIGQRYMKNPGEIHQPNENVRDFLDHMPNFKNLLQQKESLLEQTAARKDISLEEKVKAEHELNKIKSGKSKFKKALYYGAMPFIPYTAFKIGSSLLGNQGEE